MGFGGSIGVRGCGDVDVWSSKWAITVGFGGSIDVLRDARPCLDRQVLVQFGRAAWLWRLFAAACPSGPG